MHTVKRFTSIKKCAFIGQSPFGQVLSARYAPSKLYLDLLAVVFAACLFVCGLAGSDADPRAEINAASQYRRPAAG